MQGLTNEWKTLLNDWNSIAFNSSIVSVLPDVIGQSRWFGTESATEDEIIKTEGRLKVSLPPSYRAFLQVTNGWRVPAVLKERVQLPIWINGEVDRVLSISEVEWFRKKNKAAINLLSKVSNVDDSDEDDEDYFSIDPSLRNPSMAPISHLRSTLYVGTIDDCALLLNPKRINAEGEWEAWNFTPIGSIRYTSFLALMKEYHSKYREYVK
jgi:hypothetical protein